MARNYSSTATEKTLTEDIVTNDGVLITLNNIDDLPSPPYTLVINPDTETEEIVTVISDQSEITAPQLRVARAQDGTSGHTHTYGSIVKHMITARDLQDAQDHIAATTSVHGIANTSLLVTTTGAQTLTNKTINASNNTLTNIPQSSVTNLSTDLSAKATKTGAETLTNKTMSGSDNTFSDIPQSAITNLVADLAAEVDGGDASSTYS